MTVYPTVLQHQCFVCLFRILLPNTRHISARLTNTHSRRRRSCWCWCFPERWWPHRKRAQWRKSDPQESHRCHRARLESHYLLWPIWNHQKQSTEQHVWGNQTARSSQRGLLFKHTMWRFSVVEVRWRRLKWLYSNNTNVGFNSNQEKYKSLTELLYTNSTTARTTRLL